MPAKRPVNKSAASDRKRGPKSAATKQSATKKAPAAKKVSKARSTAATTATPAKILLVNMIPKALSGETNQDSEPHLTVNAADPKKIVGTAFTPDPGGGPNAPIYVSADGGNSWALNAIVPGATPGGIGTSDITTSFGRSKSTRLYAGILRGNNTNLDFLRTDDFAAPNPMTALVDRPNADQPFTHATTVSSGPDAGKDRVYIGNNDFGAPNSQTATVDQSLDAGVAGATFNSIRIEKRTTMGQDGPQVRPVAHARTR